MDFFAGTSHFYWRVTPIDSSGNWGLTSEVKEFIRNNKLMVPVLVYPFYYYPPNDYEEYPVNPYEDRTVAFPIFIWHRVMNHPPDGGVFATAYRIQVDITESFSSPVWEYDTKNTSAAPTDDFNFIPTAGQDYYWRVCVLDHIGGNCLTDINSGWSQPWKARFDPSLALQSTGGAAPELLRPAIGQEVVESIPMFEWWPYLGASQYQIEVSQDPNFLIPLISEYVDIPVFSYDDILAQNNPGLAKFGTYYWRVRGYVDGAWGNWSEVWRFQIASQSDWRSTRSPGSTENKLLIGEDPAGDIITATYDLSTLFASQSDGYWFFGFDANLTSPDMTYGLYLDVDYQDDSGASAPPVDRPYIMSTIPAHQPEYAIYIDKIGGVINAQNIWVYTWDETEWHVGEKLSDISGSVHVNDTYVEVKLPNAAIGMNQATSSSSIMLFSVNTTTYELMDSVPSDPTVPETPGNIPSLSRFSAVSDHMNLVLPPNTATGDPTTSYSFHPFFWEWPTGSNPSTPYSGFVLEVHLDPLYTNLVAQYSISTNTSFFSENIFVPPDDLIGDNTYYWRIRPRYLSEGYPVAYGAWTGGWGFHRSGVVAKNLTTSISYATPTFNWDMAESAESYQIQVATDTGFSNRVIDIITQLNSFTPSDTIAQGQYYWRVRISHGGVWNDWTPTEQYSLSFLIPTGLSPNGVTVNYAPTLCWTSQLTASRYQLQVSTDENFTYIYETVGTPNTCWTPTMGYEDVTYYWHVALIDGNGRMGNYSEPATFSKQYPMTTLVRPIEERVLQTPTFVWTPIDGAGTYVFETSWFPTFNPLYDSIETINTQYTPPWTYTNDTVYYWKVALRDRDGNLGPFTSTRVIIGNPYHVFLPVIQR